MHPLKIEDPKTVWFITTRTIGAALWFVNNHPLQEEILAHLAKYQSRYEVELYGFILMGNHYHLMARFPKANRAEFMRVFNSMIARLLERHVKGVPQGGLWAGRYRCQAVATADDVRHWLFTMALNPIRAGLTEKIGDYEGYNSFADAASGTAREYHVVNWGEFHARRRFNRRLTPQDFMERFKLRFQKLEGHEKSWQHEYRKTMLDELERRRLEIVQDRHSRGEAFLGIERLRAFQSGHTEGVFVKPRPKGVLGIVLSLYEQARRAYIEFYRNIKRLYRAASEAYRAGRFDREFPPGTYRPPGVVPCSA